MRVIKRDKYLDMLIRRIDNGMIKIITGLRRSGKSYLLNKLFYGFLLNDRGIDKNHIIRFAFDSQPDLKLIGQDLIKLRQRNSKVDARAFADFIDSRLADGGHYFLLLDEVQELEGFEYVLNGLLYKDNLDIYVTGSNARFLSVDIATEFRGRGDIVHVLPLSFSECWRFYDDDPSRALQHYLTYGGLPLAVLSQNEEDKIQYIKTQIQETYLADIITRHDVRNPSQLDDLFDLLASGVSGLVNPKKLASAFKSKRRDGLSEDTISKYIDYLRSSFLISIAKRYDVKGKNYISTPYKVYFEDIGILNAQLDFRQMEFNHIMENAIYNELRYRGFAVDVGMIQWRYTQRIDGQADKQIKSFLEIDFIANKGSKRYYIQSCYAMPSSEKREQEIRPLENTGDSFKKIVVVYENILPRQDEHGILYIGLIDFLSDPDSLER